MAACSRSTPRPARACDGFAAKGILALRDGVAEGRDISKRVYGVTSAPAIFEDLVIVGFAVDEGPGASLPGDIRAFDARTGKERWRFHTVPRPGEFGHDTWEGDGWKDRGGANAWSGLTVDESRGLVFAGLGSAAFDFYGGDRHGDNLFGNSTIALDARTGVSGSGTSRRRVTTSGTWTCRPRRCW